MKTRIAFFIVLLLLSYSIADCKEVVATKTPSRQGSVNVFTSPDLYNLTMKWANEYASLNPEVKINVIKSADKNVAGSLNTNGGIGFITDESYKSLNNQSDRKSVV